MTWPQFQPGGQRLQWGWGRQVPLNQAAKTLHPTPSTAWPRTHIKSSMNRTLVSGRAGGGVKAPGAWLLAGRAKWPFHCGPLSKTAPLWVSVSSSGKERDTAYGPDLTEWR